MFSTVTDPAAMNAELDRILGQLTTINNRLNSHRARLVRVEIGKANSGKDSGKDDGPDDDAAGGTFDSARDRAWATFRDQALRDRDRFARGFDRDFYSRGGRDYEARDGGGFDDRGPRDYTDRGVRGFASREFPNSGRDSRSIATTSPTSHPRFPSPPSMASLTPSPGSTNQRTTSVATVFPRTRRCGWRPSI